MASTSNVSIGLISIGDFQFNQSYSAAPNSASPSQRDFVTLASGLNTLTPPAGGSTPKRLTIIPPSGNTATMTLKGVTGDTGVVLHKTDWTSIALDSPVTTLALTCSAQIVGVGLFWT